MVKKSQITSSSNEAEGTLDELARAAQVVTPPIGSGNSGMVGTTWEAPPAFEESDNDSDAETDKLIMLVSRDKKLKKFLQALDLLHLEGSAQNAVEKTNLFLSEHGNLLPAVSTRPDDIRYAIEKVAFKIGSHLNVNIVLREKYAISGGHFSMKFLCSGHNPQKVSCKFGFLYSTNKIQLKFGTTVEHNCAGYIHNEQMEKKASRFLPLNFREDCVDRAVELLKNDTTATRDSVLRQVQGTYRKVVGGNFVPTSLQNYVWSQANLIAFGERNRVNSVNALINKLDESKDSITYEKMMEGSSCTAFAIHDKRLSTMEDISRSILFSCDTTFGVFDPVSGFEKTFFINIIV